MPISPLQSIILLSKLAISAAAAILAALSACSLPYIPTWPGTQYICSWIPLARSNSASCWILYEISWPELVEFLLILWITAWLSEKIHMFLIEVLIFCSACWIDFNIAKSSISNASNLECKCQE